MVPGSPAPSVGGDSGVSARDSASQVGKGGYQGSEGQRRMPADPLSPDELLAGLPGAGPAAVVQPLALENGGAHPPSPTPYEICKQNGSLLF